MSNLTGITSTRVLATFVFLLAIGFISCNKDDGSQPPTPADQQSFTVVNMVASDASFNATRVDPKLLNAWGISFSTTGTPWISATGDHSSAVYNGTTGAQQLAAVTIPTHGATTGGSPTGQIFNTSTGFKLTSNGNAARFIFAGLDGVISGWNGGAAAVTAVDRNGTSVYTGLAYVATTTDTAIYAADFKSGKIDVFDKTWTLKSADFSPVGVPTGFYPFNIQNIGGLLYVTYAYREGNRSKANPGLGIVNIFNPNGSFVKRFVTAGKLNAPWGVAQAPAGWLTGAGSATVILIGNFGDGRINAYDASSGVWLGTLQKDNKPIVIDGLWGISFKPSTATALNGDWLYFAAGPAGETKGLFGYVTK